MFTECPVVPRLISTQVLRRGTVNRMRMIKLSVRMLLGSLALQLWSSIYYLTVEVPVSLSIICRISVLKSCVYLGVSRMVFEAHTRCCDLDVPGSIPTVDLLFYVVPLLSPLSFSTSSPSSSLF